MSDDIILSMSGIEISFPGVKALKGVDFTLRKGEIHSVLGENGANKLKRAYGYNEKCSNVLWLLPNPKSIPISK